MSSQQTSVNGAEVSVLQHRARPVADSATLMELLAELPAFFYEVSGLWDGKPRLSFMSSSRYLTGHDVDHWRLDHNAMTEHLHPEDLPAYAEMYRTILGGHRRARAEYRERSVSGDLIWTLDIATCRPDRRGDLVVSGMRFDITSRRSHERSLLERERRLRAAMVTGASQIFELDSRGRLVYVSPNAISGFLSSGFLDEPETCFRIVVDEDRERVRRVVMDAIERRTGCEIGFRLVCKDRPMRYMHLTLTFFAEGLGSPGWVGVLSDVTDLETATRSARAYRQQTRAAVMRTRALLYRWNGETAVVDDLDAGVGPSTLEVHPVDLAEFQEAHREVAGTAGSRDVDFRWRSDAEPWRWVRATACSLGDGATVFGAFLPDDDTVTRERELFRVTTALSRREQEVLRLLSDGLTNRNLARALHVSEKTASRHVASLLEKLDLPNRAGAAAMAARLFDSRVSSGPL